MTDSTQDDLTSREVSTSNVSGGVQAETQGGDLNVGGDVVGRDKVVSASTYIERVEVHVHGSVPAGNIDFPVPGDKTAKLFISYKRNADPDQQLAQVLYKSLKRDGHQVFMDTTMRTGDAWLEEIDRQLKGSDFLIVLLSQQSADSEMVRAEVSRAYEYRKLQGRPQTLPVRVAYRRAIALLDRCFSESTAIRGVAERRRYGTRLRRDSAGNRRTTARSKADSDSPQARSVGGIRRWSGYHRRCRASTTAAGI